MSSTNIARSQPKLFTHEGAPARRINPLQQLRRSLLNCLLWEDTFYEDGVAIADRIVETAALCKTEDVAALAVEARRVHGLRHAPLLLLLDLVRRGGTGVAEAISGTIKRADEMGELVSLYWQRNPGKDLSKQLKLGLAEAFTRFDEYQLAKYDRDGAVKLRDVLFLSHAKPKDEAQAALFKRLVDGQLATPDTWETNLSSGGDKRETFERLLRENKLGYLALLRNLRNMVEAGCDLELVKAAIIARRGADLVFPFRYVAAARAVPQLEPVIDQALCEAVANGPALSGRTIVLVDNSGSMHSRLSAKSDMNRIDAAAALASVINGDRRVFSFADGIVEVPPRSGMAGVDAIMRTPSGGTNLGAAITAVNRVPHTTRLIVITDEQSHDRVPDPVAEHAYMINVASYQNGVGYGRWKHIDGFSEAVLRWMMEIETGDRR